jgi:hypothetical protein
MPESPHDGLAAAMVRSIATRTPRETRTLVLDLVRRSWPGGPSDRLQPTALPWVRRWGPNRMTPLPQACSCADGRCLVCN